jgi:glycerophosphoryl diester phosphodiesterase
MINTTMFRPALILLLSLVSMEARILVHGHRGARAVRPENTIPAFEYAIAEGADVLELDVAVTKDDILVVSHDPEMNATFCTGPAGAKSKVIRDMTFAELRQWDCGAKANPAYPKQKAIPGTKVPSLDEVFALAPKGKFEFNVETKIFPQRPSVTPSPERFAELMLAAIRKHKLEKRVIVQSFDFRTLKVLAKTAPEIRLSALLAFPQQDFVASAKEAGAVIVSPNVKLVTPEKVKAARAAGLQVVPWTANTPDEWKMLADAGADAIISDDPAALLAWLKARGLR